MATTRKQPEPEGIGITIRLEGMTVRRLDELVEHLKGTVPLGTRITRSSALRHAILTGIAKSLGDEE